MQPQKINFPDGQAVSIFPTQPADLAQAISTLGLKDGYPVIVLLGDDIHEQQAVMTRKVIETLARVAEETSALVLCGGLDSGVMAEIGQARKKHDYKFPLVGVTPEALVSWPGGPSGAHFLIWGKRRSKLAANYTHFILVPGSEIGDGSTWIADAATILSKGHRSVTILVNGDAASRSDVDRSVAIGRPVIALGGTGRLANDLASETRQDLITVIPGNSDTRVFDAVRAAIAGVEQTGPAPTVVNAN